MLPVHESSLGSRNELALTCLHALDWCFFGKPVFSNRGNDDGKRQQLAEQGKEEAQEGCSAEGDPGEGHAAAQETVMVDLTVSPGTANPLHAAPLTKPGEIGGKLVSVEAKAIRRRLGIGGPQGG
jgi:hypothetical protein